MLEADVGQHRHGRLHDARRVVAAAETGLDRRDIDALARHLPERGGGEQFELRHVIVLRERAVDLPRGVVGARDRGREGLRAEHAPVDQDPFAVGDQVRRGVGAGAQAVTLQDRGQHPRGRGLAVRAEHLDRVERGEMIPTTPAQRGHHAPHPVQPEAHPEQLERAQAALGARLVPGCLRAGLAAGWAPHVVPGGRAAEAPRRARRRRPAARSASSSPLIALRSSLPASLRSSARSFSERLPSRPRESRTELREARAILLGQRPPAPSDHDPALQQHRPRHGPQPLAARGGGLVLGGRARHLRPMVATAGAAAALRRTPGAGSPRPPLRAPLR